MRADAVGLPGDLLARSGDITLDSWVDSGEERVYAFPEPVRLVAGARYWLVPVERPGGVNTTYVYGSVSDPYPDGAWQRQPGWDIYFRLGPTP